MFYFYRTFLFYVVLLCTTRLEVVEAKLIFAQAIFRHGDRGPSRLLPNDNNSVSSWPLGLKQLTVLGMQQTFQLGAFLREKYTKQNKLLNESYTREEVYMRSSDSDRAVQSAQCVLAGLYPPSKDTTWNQSIFWHPVPVHTFIPNNEDKLLKPTSIDCPAYDNVYKQSTRAIFTNLDEKYKDLYRFLEIETGMPLVDTEDGMGDIYATLAIEREYNLILPTWIDQTWKDTGKTIFEIGREVKTLSRTSEFNSPEKSKFMAGYLLGTMLDNIQSVVNGDMQEKVLLFSAHQGTVMPLLYALGVASGRLLPYTSCLMLDLHQSDNEDESDAYSVQVSLRNSTDGAAAPFLLATPGCPQPPALCPVGTFVDGLKGRYYTDVGQLDAACRLSSATADGSDSGGRYFWPFVIAAAIAVLLCLVILALLFKEYQKSHRRNSMAL